MTVVALYQWNDKHHNKYNEAWKHFWLILSALQEVKAVCDVCVLVSVY